MWYFQVFWLFDQKVCELEGFSDNHHTTLEIQCDPRGLPLKRPWRSLRALPSVVASRIGFRGRAGLSRLYSRS